MPITLSPRNYKPNLSWKMLTKNKIDTINLKPILNNLVSAAVVHTEEITNVNVSGTSMNLPISNNVNATDVGVAFNTDDGAIMSDGMVEITMASGQFTLQVTNPLPSTPTAKVRFEGTTRFINRNSRTFDNFQALFANAITNFAGVIAANADDSENWTDSKSRDSTNRGILDDSTLVDYSKSIVPLYPFVRVVRAAGEGISSWQVNKLTESEVLTHWTGDYGGVLTSYCAKYDNWIGRSYPDAWASWDSIAYATIAIPFNSQRASFRNQYTTTTVNISKVSDYEYIVNWTAPVRYAYHAASRCYTLGIFGRSYHDIDSYAFLDNITKIYIDISAREMNTDSVDMSLGLDSSNNITTEVTNNYPLSFDTNEFITVGALYGLELWTNEMSKYILLAYKNGKYIVECDVYASWAIANNVQINTQMYIMLQGGIFIKRDNTIVTFEVKTIEKVFKANEFLYSLRLLEV